MFNFLIGLYISIHFMVSSVSGMPNDYDIGVGLYKQNLIDLNCSYKRISEKYHNDWYLKLTQKINKFTFHEKVIRLESQELDLYELSAQYNILSLDVGIAQLWDNNIPSQKLIISKSIQKKWKNPIVPLNIDIKALTMTSNFSKWFHEEDVRFTFKLIALLNLSYQLTISDYGNLNYYSKFMLGIEI